MEQTPHIIREAGPPFADPDADLILQTSDGINFRVHQVLLLKCSPVFADVLSSPRSARSSAVIVVAETEHPIRFLLDFCYLRLPSALCPGPTAQPVPGALDDLKLALQLSDKYGIDAMRTLALRELATCVDAAPVQVYVLAWKYRARALVLRAARATLAQPFAEDRQLPEFDDVLLEQAILRLYQYQKECRDRACATTTNLDWLTRAAFPGRNIHVPGTYSFSQTCPFCSEDTPSLGISTGFGSWWFVSRWLLVYFQSAKRALERHARGSAVEAPDVMVPALEAAFKTNCEGGNCATEALRVVPAMAKLLAAQVEKVVDEVQLETPF